MTLHNSLLLNVESLIPAEGWKGHLWAKPSIKHLRELLRWAQENRAELKAIGAAARATMVEQYSIRNFSLVLENLLLGRIYNKFSSTFAEFSKEDLRIRTKDSRSNRAKVSESIDEL